MLDLPDPRETVSVGLDSGSKMTSRRGSARRSKSDRRDWGVRRHWLRCLSSPHTLSLAQIAVGWLDDGLEMDTLERRAAAVRACCDALVRLGRSWRVLDARTCEREDKDKTVLPPGFLLVSQRRSHAAS